MSLVTASWFFRNMSIFAREIEIPFSRFLSSVRNISHFFYRILPQLPRCFSDTFLLYYSVVPNGIRQQGPLRPDANCRPTNACCGVEQVLQSAGGAPSCAARPEKPLAAARPMGLEPRDVSASRGRREDSARLVAH